MRPIWFGGKDRSEASLDEFFAWLGPKKCQRIQLGGDGHVEAVPQFDQQRHAPQAAILFDKFHIMRHLGDALDTVRKSEYARLTRQDRRFIKGQKYTLLSHRENLTLDGRRALKKLLAANKRLNTAYLLKESFGQLWGYRARRLGAALLRELEGGAEVAAPQALREVRRDDRAALGRDRGLLPAREQGLPGFVEGLNNKIRVIQRRAYGLRDEEYLRLKVLTCMLPKL